MSNIKRIARRYAKAAFIATVAVLISLMLHPGGVLHAYKPYLKSFLAVTPGAADTRLNDLPGKSGHCGLCHFDFNGGGKLNPYGQDFGMAVNAGESSKAAVSSIAGKDSDGDGFSNEVEIAGGGFSNTPTFPGLSADNVSGVVNIDASLLEKHLTPAAGGGSAGEKPVEIGLLSPTGGEVIQAGGTYDVKIRFSDIESISRFSVFFSSDGGRTYDPVGVDLAPAASFPWFVADFPGARSRIKVEAVDLTGRSISSVSRADFTVKGRPAGKVPTTMRDMTLTGTQPFEGAVLDDADLSCSACHGNFDKAHEPYFNWRGSMMAQSARDPLFYACLAIAEQDAPNVGDLCVRCHSPGGWQEGRSEDTSGRMLTAKDRQGIQCDFCHRIVDHDWVEGRSPSQDKDVLEGVDPLPLQYGNCQFINDPGPAKRGPYGDSKSSHAYLESPIHRSSDICGICHDVSNPVFVDAGSYEYVPNAFDEKHPDMKIRNMFPVERTYSEWSVSEYALKGVKAPLFAGNKPGGVVSTCQDCHMRDVNAAGAEGVAPRADLALHDLTGGNTFSPATVQAAFPSEVDMDQMLAAAERAEAMLKKAATLELTPEPSGVSVKVLNHTGHKLPSGYPEGRRIWINLKGFDSSGNIVFESCKYDPGTAELTIDEQARVYEVNPGFSPGLAKALGVPAGKSFHFVLNDTIYKDNRIPPRGFTNESFRKIQSPPVGHSYEDGQYWDIATYRLPTGVASVTATLYYQTASREYIEFLRDENRTNDEGTKLYKSWSENGRSTPVMMATEEAQIGL